MLNNGQHPLTPLNIGINKCHVPATKDLVQLMSSIMQEAKSYVDTKRHEISLMLELKRCWVDLTLS